MQCCSFFQFCSFFQLLLVFLSVCFCYVQGVSKGWTQPHHWRQWTMQMRRREVEDRTMIVQIGGKNYSFVVSLFSVFVFILLLFCFSWLYLGCPHCALPPAAIAIYICCLSCRRTVAYCLCAPSSCNLHCWGYEDFKGKVFLLQCCVAMGGYTPAPYILYFFNLEIVTVIFSIIIKKLKTFYYYSPLYSTFLYRNISIVGWIFRVGSWRNLLGFKINDSNGTLSHLWCLNRDSAWWHSV